MNMWIHMRNVFYKGLLLTVWFMLAMAPALKAQDRGFLMERMERDLEELNRQLKEAEEDLREFADRRLDFEVSRQIPVEFLNEYVPPVRYSEVASRLKKIENKVPLVHNKRVHAFVQYFCQKGRTYSRGVLSRKNLYFPIFEKYLKAHGMPEELKYLAVVESGLKPQAMSRVGAAGLWQFMPSTGKVYGLKYDYFRDERMDPEKSTVAACKHLKTLYKTFGDWELAIAAYNCGRGNVRRAIRRSGYKRNFWDIYRYLPRETRSYLPQFVAITYMFEYADEHNLVTRNRRNAIPADTLLFSQFVNLKSLSELTEVPIEDIRLMNPEIKYDALPGNYKGYSLRFPKAHAQVFREKRQKIMAVAGQKDKRKIMEKAKRTPWSVYGRDMIYHRVRRGDVLGRIALRYRVRLSDLRRWNNLRGNLIRVGQRLRIYSRSSKYLSKRRKSRRTPQNIPYSKTHWVKRGDTLWSIAKLYKGLTVQKLKRLNGLVGNRIKPGQKLRIG